MVLPTRESAWESPLAEAEIKEGIMAIHWPNNTRSWAPEVRKVVRNSKDSTTFIAIPTPITAVPESVGP